MAIHNFTDRNEQQAGQASLEPDKGLAEFDIPELQRTLKLAGLLQTSLEMESILQYFAECVQETVPFNSLEFHNAAIQFDFDYGKADRHSCAYRLSIAGDSLGEMKFTRNKRFREDEMEQLENFIYHLVYPLRNAILYQKAILAAQIDSLTGLNNRSCLDRALERELELAHRHDHDLSLLVVDVDHFKNINDSHGHSAGDTVLKALATCMQDTMRASDMLFRYGGEEFALILSGTDLDGARLMGERLRTAVSSYPFMYNNKDIPVTVSIGVATLGRRDSANRLFNKADAALYQAKKAGRNQVHVATPRRRRKSEQE